MSSGERKWRKRRWSHWSPHCSWAHMAHDFVSKPKTQHTIKWSEHKSQQLVWSVILPLDKTDVDWAATVKNPRMMHFAHSKMDWWKQARQVFFGIQDQAWPRHGKIQLTWKWPRPETCILLQNLKNHLPFEKEKHHLAEQQVPSLSQRKVNIECWRHWKTSLAHKPIMAWAQPVKNWKVTGVCWSQNECLFIQWTPFKTQWLTHSMKNLDSIFWHAQSRFRVSSFSQFTWQLCFWIFTASTLMSSMMDWCIQGKPQVTKQGSCSPSNIFDCHMLHLLQSDQHHGRHDQSKLSTGARNWVWTIQQVALLFWSLLVSHQNKIFCCFWKVSSFDISWCKWSDHALCDTRLHNWHHTDSGEQIWQSGTNWSSVLEPSSSSKFDLSDSQCCMACNALSMTLLLCDKVIFHQQSITDVHPPTLPAHNLWHSVLLHLREWMQLIQQQQGMERGATLWEPAIPAMMNENSAAC